MAQQNIFLGSEANDGTGDSVRSAGQKINSNFTELYSVSNNLHPVSSSGDYNDLSNRPAIPTIPPNLVTSVDVTNIVKISQGDYDQLNPPIATTLYLIEQD